MIFKKVPNPKKSASKAKRISGLSNYIAEPAKQNGREKCIHFRALGFVCNDLRSQQAEMLALATDATRSPDPINHYVLSWRDGERPTLKQADEAALMSRGPICAPPPASSPSGARPSASRRSSSRPAARGSTSRSPSSRCGSSRAFGRSPRRSSIAS